MHKHVIITVILGVSLRGRSASIYSNPSKHVIITVLDCTNRYCNDLGWSVVRCEKPIEHRYILFSFYKHKHVIITVYHLLLIDISQA